MLGEVGGHVLEGELVVSAPCEDVWFIFFFEDSVGLVVVGLVAVHLVSVALVVFLDAVGLVVCLHAIRLVTCLYVIGLVAIEIHMRCPCNRRMSSDGLRSEVSSCIIDDDVRILKVRVQSQCFSPMQFVHRLHVRIPRTQSY